MGRNTVTLDDQFVPGSFGWHELLDRTSVIAENFADHVAEHPSAQHPKLTKRVTKIETLLWKLYQDIGQLTP